MTTVVVLLALAGIWAAVLLPPYLQKRRATHPSSSVVDFHQQLAVLQRTGRALHGAPLHTGYARQSSVSRSSFGPTMRPPQRAPQNIEVMSRRRDVFMTMVVAAGLSLLLALIFGGSLWILHLIVDTVLLGYVAMLVQAQAQPQPVAYARPAAPEADWNDPHDPYDPYAGYEYDEELFEEPQYAEVFHLPPVRRDLVPQPAMLRRAN